MAGWLRNNGNYMSDNIQFLKEEIEHTERARQDLRDHTMKERKTVAGFLRVLKIQYEDCEIQKRGPEPIDVWFRDAHFQVMEKLDEGRCRDDEWHTRRERLVCAVTAGEFEYFQKAVEGLEPFSPPATYTSEDYFKLICSCSEKKSKRYGGDVGDIDLLVYINLRDTSLSDTMPWSDPASLERHGWRSVSFVDGVYARVLYAKKNAPDFLQAAMGKTHGDPKNDGIFPQELGPEEK